MATDNDRAQAPSKDSLEAGYEISGVGVKALAVFVLILIVFAAAIHAGAWFLFEGYLRSDRAKDRSFSALNDSEFLKQYNYATGSNLSQSRQALPPPPRLQPTPGVEQQNVPQGDLQLMYREEDSVFDRMGWTIDPQTHVPLSIPAAVTNSVIEDETRRQRSPASGPRAASGGQPETGANR